MFEEYLKEVKEAVINSEIFDKDSDSLKISFDEQSTLYNNLPAKSGHLIYGSTPIADIFVSSVPKPAVQFYEDSVHNSVGGFDVIDVNDRVFYMVGTWRFGHISFQSPLCNYEPGSNFLAVYREYLKYLEIKHKEEYDYEYEESD